MKNTVDIKLETDVVTGETVAQFVTSILEFLLYQRNQIPFVCKTFKYQISKWDKNDENYYEPANFQLERQRRLAKQTLASIKSMTELIQRAFEQCDVSCVRFLFGSTAVTPKEVYTINTPSISRSHSYENHKLNITLLNQALISLLTSDCLYNALSTNLSTTNVFLELKMPDNDANDWEQVISTEFCDFPPSCKQTVINLVHVLPAEYIETMCCSELKVFQDISTLSLEITDECEEHEMNSEKQVGWWEASTIVRGFKPTILKGSNLWQ